MDVANGSEVVETAPEPDKSGQTPTETGAEGVAEQAPEKTYTKAELTEITKREAMKAEAKAERRALKLYQDTLERILPKQAEPQKDAPRSDGRPSQSDFENVDDYVEAMAEFKIRQRDEQLKATEIHTRHESALEKAAKDKSFDLEHFLTLPVHPVVADAITDSDDPAKILVFLNANPDEAHRINSLPVARQAAEIGRLEMKLAAEVQKSKAPAPISPVGSGSGASTKLGSDMSDEEYAKWRKQGR